MATSLEQRNYIATDADIENLTGEILSAQFTMESGPRRYLRAVVATTIHELDAPQRVRTGKVEKIDEAEQTRQLAALDKVLQRFYPIVIKRASENLPAGKARALELNRRTNWARSNAYSVREWIRAGRDLRPLAPGRLIKAALDVPKKPRAPSPGRIKGRVERNSKALVTSVMELAAADRTSAIAEIQLLIGQLAGQLEELGVTATKDAKAAVAEHRPLRLGKSVFFPTETAILRMQESPS